MSETRLDIQNHHRRSIRLPGYDYAQAGAYFVTVVTQYWKCILGEVKVEKVHPSEIGRMVEREWLRLPRRFKNLELLDFVIMPNHLHGIIMVSDTGRGTGDCAKDEHLLESPRAPTPERFGMPVAGSIPTIMRSFKASTTRRFRDLLKDRNARLWQRNYYEHVIRDEADLARVRAYILGNPARWGEDRENLGREETL